MKLAIVLTAVVLVAACAGVPDRAGDRGASGTTTNGQQALHSAIATDLAVAAVSEQLRLEFDTAGNWVRIVTIGTAEIAGGEAGSGPNLETAYQAAALRAKRSLAEFLSTDIRSRKTLKRIARTYVHVVNGKSATDEGFDLASDELDESPDQGAGSRVAAGMVERISAQSAAILKGAHVTRRGRQEGVALVEVSVSRISIEAAREISLRMNGSL